MFYLEGRTAHRSGQPAGRSCGASAPPALGEGSWTKRSAGAQTETQRCCVAWWMGNLEMKIKMVGGSDRVSLAVA